MSSSTNAPPDIDRSTTMIAVYAVEYGLSLLFVILRVWARLSIRSTSWDDYFMVATCALFTSVAALAVLYATSGGTRHPVYLERDQEAFVTEIFYISQAVHIITIGVGKLAIGSLLLRLLGPVSKWRRYGIWLLMVLISIFSVLALVFSLVQCPDPADLWNPDPKAVTACWDPAIQSKFTIFFGSLSSAVDFAFALLPITLVWKLHLTLRKKIGLVVLLGGGVLSGICAAVKADQLAALANRDDLLWATFDLYLWSGAEISLMIICGCVPTIKPLWDRFFGGMLSRTRKESNQQSRSHHSQSKRWTTLFRGQKHRAGFELSSINYSLDNITHPTEANAFSNNNRRNRPRDSKDATSTGPAQEIEGVIQVSREFHVDWTDRA
ncbi:hypothetical protein Hte_010333 [Hypoxylon texense]